MRPTGGRGPGAVHFLPRYAQEVGGRQVVVDDDEDGGLRSVLVGGLGGGVVAQVRGNAGGPRDEPHGAALPLQEEGPGHVVAGQSPEGVGVDGAQLAPVAEIAAGRSSSGSRRRLEHRVDVALLLATARVQGGEGVAETQDVGAAVRLAA